ncbi:hypothetical protein [Halospeciosus flavus]|uniref:hypothetical protein n=1 Tax=Halospeciosus flavus TaxID=3032283 RepID=UPI00361C26CA
MFRDRHDGRLAVPEGRQREREFDVAGPRVEPVETVLGRRGEYFEFAVAVVVGEDRVADAVGRTGRVGYRVAPPHCPLPVELDERAVSLVG